MIRVLDVFFSLMGVVLLSPLFLIIPALIKLTSKGPVFYLQNRVGKNNVDFLLFKFRTMHVDSDKEILLTVGKRDNRITGIGIFLRKYKLDELPQLFNVISGEMSLVGPRPEVRKYINHYTPFQMKVLSVKPGITDWASIIYRDENEILGKSNNPEQEYVNIILPMKIKYNQIYIERYGYYEYCKILLATGIKIFFPKFHFKIIIL